MIENNETKESSMKAPVFTAFDCDFSVPPAPPCSREEYDEWFRAKVQASVDNPDEPTFSHEEVMAATQIIIDSKRMEKELRERAKS